jgi:uncharacterized cupin superfamily protein
VSKTPATILPADAPRREGSRYPAPHNELCMKRSKAVLGDVFGLDQFGVNLVTLAPGGWSSQRHWHVNEDEFVYVVEGELTLCDDDGEHLMSAGMCAGFKANNGNGHCLKNLTEKFAVYLEVGTRAKIETGYYSDIDMMFIHDETGNRFLHKDGSAF